MHFKISNKEDWLRMKEQYDFGLPIAKIARQWGLGYGTARRYLFMSEAEYDEAMARDATYLDQYREFMLEELRANPQIKSTNIWYRLQEEFPEFDCTAPNVRDYVKKLRDELGGIFVRKRITTIRKPLTPGYEAQVDFGQMKLPSMYPHCQTVRVYFFCMVLSYSRMRYVYFSAEPFTTKSAIEAHDYAFKFFGGRPQTIMYDQDRVFVVSENYGNFLLVPQFEKYVKEVGFSVVLCRPRDPQTKGRIEETVNYVKHSFLEGRTYRGIQELNMAALNWLDLVANVEHNQTMLKPPNELFKEESRALIKVPHVQIDRVEIRTVSNDYTISFEHAIYQLPPLIAQPHVKFRIEKKDDKLYFYTIPLGALVYEVAHADPGSCVPCDDTGLNITSATEEKMRRRLDGVDVRDTFIKELELTVPRYKVAHMRKINHLIDGYGIENVEEAMEYCLLVNTCTSLELAAYLIYKYGEGKAKQYLEKNYFYTCRTRAEGIRRERSGRYE